MDFNTLLSNRRAIRDFRDQEPPLSVIREIIQESCLAPTASNLQPCRFVIVQNRDFMKRLSDESKRNLVADIVSNPESPMKQYEDSLRNEGFNVFYNAPCLVYITGPRGNPTISIDCALTAAYFMFSATARGLGTCWIALGGDIRDPKTLSELGIPKDDRIIAPLIVGYPVAIPSAPERHAPVILEAAV